MVQKSGAFSRAEVAAGGEAFRNSTNYSQGYKPGTTITHADADLKTGYISGSGGVTIYIDMRDGMARLSKAFSVFGDQVKNRALYNAVNYAGRGLRTAIIRDVVAQTSLSRSRVASAIVADPAHPNRLTYKLIATDKATKLGDFKGSFKPGQKNPSVRVWGKTTKFNGAFVVKFAAGDVQIVKRIAKHRGGIKSHTGPLGVKVLYGPIVPREMIRPGSRALHTLNEVMPRKLMPRLQHEFEQAVARAKAASGT